MLQSDNGTIQYLTCKALLSFSDSADSVNVAIDMIDLSKPRDDAPVNSGTISMLRRRFATTRQKPARTVVVAVGSCSGFTQNGFGLSLSEVESSRS